MYEIKRAKRLSQDFVHFVTARASLFTEHIISALDISEHFVKQTVDNSCCDFVKIFPHISLRNLPCHKTKKILFVHQVSLKLWSVVFPKLLNVPKCKFSQASLYVG